MEEQDNTQDDSIDEQDLEETRFEMDDKNYAEDTDKAGKALEFLKKVSHEVRSRRQTLDQRYLMFYNIFRCIFDVKYYEGTSQVYIPQLRKNIENYVARLKQALFPTDDLLEVQPVDPEMSDQSQPIATYMNWIIDKRVKIKLKIDRFLRQFVMYGWAVVKCPWVEEIKEIVGLEKVVVPIMQTQFDPLLGKNFKAPSGRTRVEIREVKKKIIKKKHPDFLPVDNMAFYLYPVTANSLDECDGVIELSKQSLWHLKQRGKDGDYANTDELQAGYADKTDLWAWTKEQRLAVDGQTDQQTLPELPRFTIMEYWGKYNWGTDDEPEWKDTLITTTGDCSVCLQLRVNPFYDQDIPYDMARMTELQNEAYPSGLMEPLASLQYYLNDTYNQTFDALLYELNPIIKYDPGRVVNINSIAFAPGAMWALSDPDAAKFDRPPDVSQIGFFAASQATSLINGYPGLQEIPMAGRKAATHISALQQEYSLPIIQYAQNIEEQVMAPWLKKAYMRIQQFVDTKEKFFVTGKSGIKGWEEVSPEMLVADYNFYWKGSNAATNIHVRAEQMIKFVQMLTPTLPFVQQQGGEVDLISILNRIWNEGLALDGTVVKDVQKDASIDPETENVLLALGKFIPVSVNDDHMQHLQSHEAFMQQVPPEQAKLMSKHIAHHQFQLKQQQAAMMAMQGQGRPAGPEQEGEAGQQQEEVPGQRMLQGIQPPNPGSPY